MSHDPNINEKFVQATLKMDRDYPLGNSEDRFLRRALHVKVGNSDDEGIPVFLVNPPDTNDRETLNLYGEANSLAKTTETTMVTYTVPVGKKAELCLAEGEGDNGSSIYKVKKNGTIIAKKNVWFGAKLDVTFLFAVGTLEGLELTAGDIIIVTVEHCRDDVGDFSGRLIVAEMDA